MGTFMAPQKTPPHETGKQRAARIPLDYYKRTDGLERWKVRLAGVALLVTLGWLGASWAISGQDDFQSSRGPLASVHQSFDNQCQACHEPFTSISSHSWDAPFLGDAKESSQKCQACHSGAVHHKGQTPELSCAACHRDHRGREASLVRLPDSDCTQCHNDLSGHVSREVAAIRGYTDAKKVKGFDNSVTKFATATHPAFRSIVKDPGKLEFSHRLHLSAGMALREGDQVGGTIKVLGQIPKEFRDRYRSQQQDKGDKAPVQLQCASCHQQDAGDAAAFAKGPRGDAAMRGSGAYMLPINYENHCQACHPLTIDHKQEGAKVTQVAVPHRWQPPEIHTYLDNYFTAKLAKGLWEKEENVPKMKDVPPLPGQQVKAPVPEAELEKVRKAVKTAESYLDDGRSGCALCHEIKRSAAQTPLQIVAPNVPQVWFKHALFNHAAHRAVTCLECHSKAPESRFSSDVLIPGQDNCVKCHAPVTEAGTPGVRSTCTTCHLYHNGDHSLQGIGAANRRPRESRTITEFLQGMSK
jgi:hypothetical protein